MAAIVINMYKLTMNNDVYCLYACIRNERINVVSNSHKRPQLHRIGSIIIRNVFLRAFSSLTHPFKRLHQLLPNTRSIGITCSLVSVFYLIKKTIESENDKKRELKFHCDDVLKPRDSEVSCKIDHCVSTQYCRRGQPTNLHKFFLSRNVAWVLTCYCNSANTSP